MILIFIIGLLEALVGAFLVYRRVSQNDREAIENLAFRKEELGKKIDLESKILELKEKLVDFGLLAEKALEFQELQDIYRAERGRSSITRAELDTLETRLRELVEIERELEASGLETKEEMKILVKKEKDLLQKNDLLKEQIEASMQQFEQLTGEAELSSDLTGKIDEMKAQLLVVQEKARLMLTQIEFANQQYFSLKQRYDALDIEYAQLYEKFSEENPA